MCEVNVVNYDSVVESGLRKEISELNALVRDLAGKFENQNAEIEPKRRPYDCYLLDSKPADHQPDKPLLMPEPEKIRAIIRRRQLRYRYFDPELFHDPVWDMLLDLIAARGENTKVSVTSLCIASGVPHTTALRYINDLVQRGIFKRNVDPADNRRTFIDLSNEAAENLLRYFSDYV